MATSQVHTVVTRLIVSQVHIPLAASGGYIHAYSGQLVTSGAYIPTLGMYVPPSGAYLPTYRVSHGTSHAMTYRHYYGTQDRFLHLTEVGINNLLTLLIMAL